MKATVIEEIRSEDSPLVEEKDVYTTHFTRPSSPVAEWPTSPQTLTNTPMQSTLMILYDVALITIPIALLIKIGFVVRGWKADENVFGITVNEYVSQTTLISISINKQLVTLFTILFISIISTLVRRYALWKAQRGAFVSELEQLYGSISMVSTVKLIWSLRAFTTTSLGLVVIWAFYYLGSQACEQEYRLVDSEPFHQQVGAIIRPGAVSAFSSSYGLDSSLAAGKLRTMLITAEELHTAGLSSGQGTRYVYSYGHLPPRYRGFDPEGSAVLPRLDCLLAKCKEGPVYPNKDGWVSSSDVTQSYYTSLIGYPVWTKSAYVSMGSPRDPLLSNSRILGSYQAGTSYIDVACGAPSSQPFDAFPKGASANQSVTINGTRILQPAVLDSKGAPLRVLDLWFRLPANFGGSSEEASFQWTCNLTQVYADMQVGCSIAGCVVQKIRLANNASPQQARSHSTPFDDDILATKLIDTLLLFPNPQESLSNPTTMAMYLSDAIRLIPANDTLQDSMGQYLSRKQINEVITRYVNGFHMASQIVLPSGGDPTKSEQDGGDGNYQQIKVNGAVFAPHYAISWPWLAVDAIACLILLAASIISTLLRMTTLAPDILGSVSSMTRDNPYLRLPDSGSTLSGLERSRMLKNVKVKLGDVSSDEYGNATGRVGLARVAATDRQSVDWEVKQLSKDIKYV